MIKRKKAAAPTRREPLTETIHVRLPIQLIEEARRRAVSDDVALSHWIRRAVQKAISPRRARA